MPRPRASSNADSAATVHATQREGPYTRLGTIATGPSAPLRQHAHHHRSPRCEGQGPLACFAQAGGVLRASESPTSGRSSTRRTRPTLPSSWTLPTSIPSRLPWRPRPLPRRRRMKGYCPKLSLSSSRRSFWFSSRASVGLFFCSWICLAFCALCRTKRVSEGRLETLVHALSF